MKTRSLIATLTALMLSFPVLAEPAGGAAPAPALPDGGVDLTLTYATNYVWRGADIYASKYKQESKMYGTFQAPGAFQPSLTLKTPVEGLSFNIWGSFALTGRDDKDIDGRIQRAPGGSNLLTTGDVVRDINTFLASPNLPTTVAGYDTATCSAATSSATVTTAPGTVTAGSASPNCGPARYKEQVGLKRFDEVDLTLGYSAETKKGVVGMGLINYINPGPVGKSSFGAITELYVSYAFPFLTELTFTAYSGIDGVQEQYYLAMYKRALVDNKTLKLEASVGAGYKVKEKLQGWNDVTAALAVTFSGITLSANLAHRPDLRFFDGDPNNKLPMWADGTSNSGDGLVEDPSKNQGLLNDAINGALTAQLYPGTSTSYVARSKLPRNIVWFTAGYSTSF